MLTSETYMKRYGNYTIIEVLYIHSLRTEVLPMCDFSFPNIQFSSNLLIVQRVIMDCKYYTKVNKKKILFAK